MASSSISKDLVLHDAGHDIWTPTHELTIARDVLRTRRRIATRPAAWALSADGLRGQRRVGGGSGEADETADTDMTDGLTPAAAVSEAGRGGEAFELDPQDALAAELAAIDAVIASSEAALSETAARRRPNWDKDPLIYDLERVVPAENEGLPPVLRAVSSWTPGMCSRCWSMPLGLAGSWQLRFCAPPASQPRATCPLSIAA